MKIKPKEMGCFEQVANVIGKKQAKIELKKVLEVESYCCNGGIYNIVKGDLVDSFEWAETPQGYMFWNSIDDGYVPEGLSTKTLDDMVKEEYSKPTSPPSLKFIYINYKGDVGVREVINPTMEYLVDDKYHGTGWCMKAFDVDKGKERFFAVKDVIKYL